MMLPIVVPVPPFRMATLVPVALLLVGSVFGGAPLVAALLWLTFGVAIIDRLVTTAGPTGASGVRDGGPARLAEGLAVAHLAILVAVVAGLVGVTGLSFGDRLMLLFGAGLHAGLVSVPAAEALLRKGTPRARRLGLAVLVSVLCGHRAVALDRIHRKFLGTEHDPFTATFGQGFWNYLPSAATGTFSAGWEIEASVLREKGIDPTPFRHPYTPLVAASVGLLLLAAVAGGFDGALSLILVAALAQGVTHAADYVLHYGLTRRVDLEGEPEPVGPWHAWNSADWASSGLMLNLTRHSDLHAEPLRDCSEFGLWDEEEAPRLPSSLPVMMALAMVPPLFRRLMDSRARAWQRRIDHATRVPEPRPPVIRPAAPEARPDVAADPEAPAPLKRASRWRRASATAAVAARSDGPVELAVPDARTPVAEPTARPPRPALAERVIARTLEQLDDRVADSLPPDRKHAPGAMDADAAVLPQPRRAPRLPERLAVEQREDPAVLVPPASPKPIVRHEIHAPDPEPAHVAAGSVAEPEMATETATDPRPPGALPGARTAESRRERARRGLGAPPRPMPGGQPIRPSDTAAPEASEGVDAIADAIAQMLATSRAEERREAAKGLPELIHHDEVEAMEDAPTKRRSSPAPVAAALALASIAGLTGFARKRA